MINRLSKLIALTFIIVLLFPSTSTIVSSSPSSENSLPSYTSIVDPLLLEPATYTMPYILDGPDWFISKYYEIMQLALSKGGRLREGQVKAIITASPNIDLAMVASNTRSILGVLRLPTFTYIEAFVTRDDVDKLAKTPRIYSIMAYRAPLSSILYEDEIIRRSEDHLGTIESTAGDVEPDMYKAVEVIGASRVWEEFDITGKGVVVAVVDTGVDFGSPGLGSSAIARTPEGIPMIFDSDMVGLTLTLVTSAKDAEGFIMIPPEGVPYFDGWFWTAGVAKSGWVYYSSPAGRVFYVEFPLDRYYVGGITSASGTYRFGLAIQYYTVSGTLYWSVPVLYVDSRAPGVYDTVYADLSTMYYYLLVALNATGVIRAPPESAIRYLRDFSFADEKPARFGDEVLARDFTGDGVNDLSIGALAGYLYDFLGVLTGEGPANSWFTGFDYTGKILPGMDPRGRYVTIAYDYHSHGSSVANTIASRYDKPVDLGYGRFSLKGIAPDSLIAANTGLVNPFISVLFFSGLDLVRVEKEPMAIWEWIYTGKHKADIISNSWGSSFVLLAGFASSVTNYALIWDYVISTTKTIIVHAGGNGAPGYGTMTTPGDSAFAITLGASTLFDYRPAFGFLPGTWDDVVSWSARGPTNVGLVKPDVVNIGSFEWAFTHTLAGLGSGIRAITLFSGTSQATPMTSGSVALIVSYMKSKGLPVDPGFVKTLVKSSARDLGYNAYVQGSGHVDVYRAITALERGGVPIASSTSVATNLYRLFGFNSMYYPVQPIVEDTQLYTGPVKPGSSKTLTLNLRVLTGDSLPVTLEAVTFKVSREGLTKYLDLERGYAVVGGRIVPLTTVLTGFGDNYITIKLVRGLSRIMVPASLDAFKGADMVELAAWVPYSVFDPFGRAGVYTNYLYLGLELHYGVDANNDTIIAVSETQRINYDIRIANVLHLAVGKPIEKFKLAEEQASRWLGKDISKLARGPMLDLRIISSRYVDVDVTFYLELRRHVRASWDWISLESRSLTLKPNDVASLKVTVNVPADATPGFYEGYIVARYTGGETLVPVSVPVAIVVGKGTENIVVSGWQDYSYNNYAVEGQFDWGWRYESADWRSFPVIVEDPRVAGYLVTVLWSGPNTSIDVAVAGLGPTLLTVPEDTLFYGAVYAAKLNFPPYYPRHGIQAIYDSPTPKMATIFAPDYGFILERLGFDERLPSWIIVKNVVADASVDVGYPERFTLILRPIRVDTPTSITIAKGSTAKVDIKVYGSYALSFATVVPLVIDGFAELTVEPEVLGFSDTHTVTLLVRPEEPSLVLVALILNFAPQVSIGYNIAGIKVEDRIPGLLLIPIVVNIS